MTSAPSEDSDQLGPPPSLIRVFALRMTKGWVISYPLSIQRRLLISDWADDQADLSLRRTRHFVCFVMELLILWNRKGHSLTTYLLVKDKITQYAILQIQTLVYDHTKLKSFMLLS